MPCMGDSRPPDVMHRNIIKSQMVAFRSCVPQRKCRKKKTKKRVSPVKIKAAHGTTHCAPLIYNYKSYTFSPLCTRIHTSHIYDHIAPEIYIACRSQYKRILTSVSHHHIGTSTAIVPSVATMYVPAIQHRSRQAQAPIVQHKWPTNLSEGDPRPENAYTPHLHRQSMVQSAHNTQEPWSSLRRQTQRIKQVRH